MRIDEPKRLVRGGVYNKTYPLVDWTEEPKNKQDILDWWEDQEFDLGIPEHLGNCVGCFKKSTKKLLKVVRDEPKLLDNNLELEYGYVGKNKIKGVISNLPRKMYRQHMSLEDVKDLYRKTDPLYLRDITADDGENEDGCSSSCEAFAS